MLNESLDVKWSEGWEKFEAWSLKRKKNLNNEALKKYFFNNFVSKALKRKFDKIAVAILSSYRFFFLNAIKNDEFLPPENPRENLC